MASQNIDQNKLAMLLRQHTDRISELEVQLKAARKNEGYVSFKEKTIRDALKATPNWYVWEITFAQYATQRTPVTLQTDPRGYFFAERMHMAWRPTGGAGIPATMINHWQPISNDNPVVVGAEVGLANAIPHTAGMDFYWEYSEGSSSLMRMNAAVSGSLLYRCDLDGIVPGSDGWQPSTTVTFYITPIGGVVGGTGTPWAGVFHIAVGGIQTYQTVV